MSIRILLYLSSIALLLFQATSLAEDLKIFGYGQIYHRTSIGLEGSLFDKLGVALPKKGTTYSLQEFNLMASNNFGDGFSAFANIEFTNSFDQRNKWGNLSLQEVFAKYQNSDGSFNVKIGTFLPKFNSFLETYNRFPLIPFIIRPNLYETEYWTFFNLDDFVCSKANLQFYGEIPFNNSLSLDYAIYHANPEVALMANYNPEVGNLDAGGTNVSAVMQYGGRIGLNLKTDDYGALSFGGSLSLDKDNQQLTTNSNDIKNGGFNGIAMDFGTIPRQKIGVDFKYQYKNLIINGEYVFVNTKLNESQSSSLKIIKDSLKLDTNLNPDIINDIDFNKVFYYISGEYKICEKMGVFLLYSKLQDNWSPLILSGMEQYGAGLNFALNDNILLKSHFQILKLKEPNLLNASYQEKYLYLSMSFVF